MNAFNRWPDPTLQQALAPLAARVQGRYWVETLRLMLVWGFAAADGALLILWFTPLYDSVFPAGIFGAAALMSVFLFRAFRFPSALKITHVADELGLNGKAITAYRLLEKNQRDSWSRFAIQDGIRACKNMDCKKTYAVVPSWRSWRGVILLAGVLLVTLALPAPLAPYWQEREAEKEALTAAAGRSAEAVRQIKQLPPEQKELLPVKLREDLNALPREIGRAKDRREAAGHLERAGREIEDVLALFRPAALDVRRLADAWKNSREPLLQKMASALEKGEGEEIARLVEKLKKLANQESPGKKESALGIFRAAEAVNDPVLRENLRKLASSLLFAGEDGNARRDEQAQSLTGTLTGLAQRAAAADRLARVSAAMFDIADALAAGSNAQVIARAGGGAGSRSPGGAGMPGGAPGGSSGGEYGPGSSSLSAGGNGGAGDSGGPGGAVPGPGFDGNALGGEAGSGGSGSAGGGADGVPGDGRGGGPGGGAGSGPGNNGAGNGTGSGSGGPGSGGQGAGAAGGGFDKIYAPHLLGGSGPETHVSGRLGPGFAGTETGLPDSPTELGAVRPYREVFPLYREEAINSLSSAPLPPDLESLVWQYFTSLE